VCNPIADIVFLIDQSSSIRPTSWSTNMQFIASVINRFTVGPNTYRVAAVKYSTSATLVFNLNQYTSSSQAASAVLNINQEGGTTNLAAGFILAFSQVLAPNPRLGASQVRTAVDVIARFPMRFCLRANLFIYLFNANATHNKNK
jgi:von Willebrand factor type A domain